MTCPKLKICFQINYAIFDKSSTKIFLTNNFTLFYKYYKVKVTLKKVPIFSNIIHGIKINVNKYNGTKTKNINNF